MTGYPRDDMVLPVLYLHTELIVSSRKNSLEAGSHFHHLKIFLFETIVHRDYPGAGYYPLRKKIRKQSEGTVAAKTNTRKTKATKETFIFPIWILLNILKRDEKILQIIKYFLSVPKLKLVLSEDQTNMHGGMRLDVNRRLFLAAASVRPLLCLAPKKESGRNQGKPQGIFIQIE